jgi:sarcosine oxidase subunit gamma
MPSRLEVHSGVEHVLAACAGGCVKDAGVTIALRHDPALAMLMVRRNQLRALIACVREAFGVELAERRCIGSGALAFAWAGAGQWLAMEAGADGVAFEQRLRAALGSLASVSDQSDGRTVTRVGGPRARDTLAKGVPIDLHPSTFHPGDAAVTVIAYVAAHIWQLDEAPTYEIIVPRSYAPAFLEWLIGSAAEFGFTFAGPGGPDYHR